MLPGAMPPPPQSVDYTTRVTSWPMFDNDTLGNCTVAAIGHLIQLYSSYTKPAPLVMSNANIINTYSDVGGYVSGDSSTDNGAVEQDVLNYWMNHGVPVNDIVNKITGFAKINVAKKTELQYALYWFGGAYIGIDLPLAWQSTSNWEMPSNLMGANAPGSWGGHCFTGDTKISMLDGTELAIKYISKDTDSWVYSIDDTGKIVPGKARSLGCTGKNQAIYSITLDNGETIKCTKDHLFKCRDGQYKKAIDLKPGESLMPLYRKVSNTKDIKGYEMVYNPETNKWKYTHRLVAAETKENYGPGKVVHHDPKFGKRNNNPEHLSIMTWEEHTELHAGNGSVGNGLLEYAKSDQGRNKSRELMKNLWSNPIWRANRIKKNKENGKNTIKKMLDFVKINGKSQKQIDAAKKSLEKNSSLAHTIEANKKRSETVNNRFANDREYREMKIAIAKQNVTKTPTHQKAILNHKVISIDFYGYEDVYDITVEKYHNFALSAGIFVHNSIPVVAYDQDYLTVITWGEKVQLSWAAYESFVDESWAVVDALWTNQQGKCPANNFDWSQLLADMSLIQQGVV